jgi:hypothetical protein
MNRTQKGAWFTLGIAILLIVFAFFVGNTMLAAGGRLAGVRSVKFMCWVIVLFMIGGAVYLRRRQSHVEPDSDERDNAIRKNAVLVSFVSVWVALAAASVVPALVVGDYGSVPVAILPLIHMGVLLTALLVYPAAVLIQYRPSGRGEQS